LFLLADVSDLFDQPTDKKSGHNEYFQIVFNNHYGNYSKSFKIRKAFKYLHLCKFYDIISYPMVSLV